MNYEKYLKKIDTALALLEERGEIVITTTIPQNISKIIFHSVFEELLDSGDQSDALIECDIPYLLEQTATNLSSIFSLNEEHSKSIVNIFYNRLLQRLSMREIAEMIWHETPFEMSLLSYYCIELKNLDSRDFEYIDWRKKYYDKKYTKNNI